MDAGQLSQLLGNQAEDVARMLYPLTRWKKEGRQLCMGSVSGDEGHSLKLNLSGQHAGHWKDFATGEHGDLIDLWMVAKHIQLSDALEQVKAYLGVRETQAYPLPAKVFNKPEPPKEAKADAVVKYLTGERKLTAETLKAFRVESKASVNFRRDNTASDAYYLPSFHGDTLTHWKMIGIQRKPNGKKLVVQSVGTQPSLFGWQALDPNASTVAITEGEVDAMTLHQYGVPALSVPCGAGDGDKLQWLEYEYPNLERFKTIYIWMDADDAGKRGIPEMVKRLGAHRCKVVEALHKDANEALVSGMNAEYIQACLAEAKYLEPDVLVDAGRYVDDVIDLLHPENDKELGDYLPWPKTHQTIRLRRRELSIWTGYNGHGKSQLLGEVVLNLVQQGCLVCVASLEMAPARLLARMTKQATAMGLPSKKYIQHVHEWLSGHLWVYDRVGIAGLRNLLEVFTYARRRYGISHFVIDNLMMLDIGEDDYSKQKDVLVELAAFKEEHDCHVHLVVHPRKGKDDDSTPPNKFSIKGSGNITNFAENVFIVWRNKPKEIAIAEGSHSHELMESPDVTLICDKQRNGDWEGKTLLWYDKASYRYVGNPGESPNRYVNYEGGIYGIA